MRPVWHETKQNQKKVICLLLKYMPIGIVSQFSFFVFPFCCFGLSSEWILRVLPTEALASGRDLHYEEFEHRFRIVPQKIAAKHHTLFGERVFSVTSLLIIPHNYLGRWIFRRFSQTHICWPFYSTLFFFSIDFASCFFFIKSYELS